MSTSAAQPLLATAGDDRQNYGGDQNNKIEKCIAVSLVILIIIASLTAGLLTRYATFSEGASLTLGAGDVWSISIQKSGVFSGAFCSEYGVTATSPEGFDPGAWDDKQTPGVFNVYALSAQASAYKEMVNRDIHDGGEMGPYAFHKYFVYHIPKRGSVDVYGCSNSNDSDISVVRCTDEKAALRLIDNGPDSVQRECSNRTCSVFSKCGRPDHVCGFSGESVGDTKAVQPVVLVVYRTTGQGTNEDQFKIKFKITGLKYSLDNEVASCVDATSSCNLSVPLTAADIVLETPTDTPMNPVQLTGTCIPRIPMYIGIFGAVPAVLILCLGVFCFFVVKTKRLMNKASYQADRRREYRTIGRQQEDLEYSAFLQPNHQQPPDHHTDVAEHQTNIQTNPRV